MWIIAKFICGTSTCNTLNPTLKTYNVTILAALTRRFSLCFFFFSPHPSYRIKLFICDDIEYLHRIYNAEFKNSCLLFGIWCLVSVNGNLMMVHLFGIWFCSPQLSKTKVVYSHYTVLLLIQQRWLNHVMLVSLSSLIVWT